MALKAFLPGKKNDFVILLTGSGPQGSDVHQGLRQYEASCQFAQLAFKNVIFPLENVVCCTLSVASLLVGYLN